MEKKDVVILAAERSYRNRYIEQALSGVSFRSFHDLNLRPIDVGHLIDNYVKFGLVGSYGALKHRDDFASKLSSDPIAVACCRILNDYHPLDRIIKDMFQVCDEEHRVRYVMAALAQHCFSGGVNYEILASASGRGSLKDQLRKDHPLPLSFFDDLTNSYVVPQNATIARRVIQLESTTNRKGLLRIFVALANQVAPRVNRTALQRRSPEARLAGRLFDFDAITEDLLHELASDFYKETQTAWQWNSRYWEQVALLNLSLYRRASDALEGLEALNMAVRHARHAVSIEFHPHSLTTLGKVLIAQMTIAGTSLTLTYGEAFDNLTEAIRKEKAWSRKAVHPYLSLFRGTKDFLERGGQLSTRQLESIQRLIHEATLIFSRDREMQEVVNALKTSLDNA